MNNTYIAEYDLVTYENPKGTHKKELFFAESAHDIIEKFKRRANLWHEDYRNLSIKLSRIDR